MTLTIAEMRAAIHMTHACEATKLVSAERATYRHDDGEEVVDVHLFEISGHPHARQCFVWADVVDPNRTIVPVVLRTRKVPTSDRAVLTYRRRLPGNRQSAVTRNGRSR